MAKPSTVDLLKAHAPISAVLFEVVAQVRQNEKLSDALDASLSDPDKDNVRVRFLTNRRAYEIVLVFDAKPWRLAEPDAAV